MKKSTPLISVIICTYNTKKITLECLAKLKESIDFINKLVEVVVVENGNDGTGEIIKKKYPWVKLIDPGVNTGFSKGNNLGLKNADKNAEYFLLLNSDAFVKKDTLSNAVAFMNKVPSCDVLGCRLVHEDGKLQFSAGYIPTPSKIFNWALGLDLIPGLNKLLKPFHPNFPEFFSNSKEVGWVMGAFWLLKNNVVRKTIGFDENYFMYGEEVEWCKRITDAGFNIWYTSEFEVVHLVSVSSSRKNAFLREVEGVYYFIKKHYPTDIHWVRFIVKTGMLLRFFAFKIMGNSERSSIHLEAAKI